MVVEGIVLRRSLGEDLPGRPTTEFRRLEVALPRSQQRIATVILEIFAAGEPRDFDDPQQEKKGTPRYQATPPTVWLVP